MPSYSLTAINIGGFPLGESDKVVSMFSRERGLVRAVAKGAKKPGTKMSGKSEALCANNLLLAKGKSLDIITQAESIDTFRKLRGDLTRLTYALYYAELTQAFGEGLEEESQLFFHVLFCALSLQESAVADARQLSLEFQMFLLNQLGVLPELTVCVKCRQPLTEYNITAFYSDLGGIGCSTCAEKARRQSAVAETAMENDSPGSGLTSRHQHEDDFEERGTFVTPLVWKILVSAESTSDCLSEEVSAAAARRRALYSDSQLPALEAAHRLVQRYLEDRAGKHMRTLDILKQF